jgi:hypothetical protein
MAIYSNGQVGWFSGIISPPSTLNNGLVGVWNADNNANDSFGSNNGVAYGGTTYTNGKINQAFNLNGSNSYVQLQNNTLHLQEFSYSQWVYFKSLANAESYMLTVINGNGVNVNYGTAFGVVNNKLSLAVFNNANGSIWQSSTLVINQWYLLTVTKKASEAPKFYINGNLQSTTLLTGSNTLNPSYTGGIYTTTPPIIGAYAFNNVNNGYGYANALIDSTNVWNRELTSTEAAGLYNGGSGKQYPF